MQPGAQGTWFPMYPDNRPKVGKYRPSLAFGQSDGWEGGMEDAAIEELRQKLRRDSAELWGEEFSKMTEVLMDR